MVCYLEFLHIIYSDFVIGSPSKNTNVLTCYDAISSKRDALHVAVMWFASLVQAVPAFFRLQEEKAVFTVSGTSWDGWVRG